MLDISEFDPSKRYRHNGSKSEVKVYHLELSGRGSTVHYERQTDKAQFVTPLEIFLAMYSPISNTQNSINQDIIKLIESGYEFKEFYGTTCDDKEFHISMDS